MEKHGLGVRQSTTLHCQLFNFPRRRDEDDLSLLVVASSSQTFGSQRRHGAKRANSLRPHARRAARRPAHGHWGLGPARRWWVFCYLALPLRSCRILCLVINSKSQRICWPQLTP
ncbi:hypothetical protein DPEC_G00069420 [Dallia pectoralis]|uniref:Uncharacterized protein n=1 Tax=Dallia pectoralis TaxID=75939 RepID=A0ACC2H2F6_DALPE|nr:hypothetical protein DPEC_G00069420 [Dallia pectoralis]